MQKRNSRIFLTTPAGLSTQLLAIVGLVLVPAVGLERLQDGGDVAADIDAGQPVIQLLQNIGAGLAGAQRDLPLRRPSAHQDCNVLSSVHPPRSAFP